MKQLFFRYDKYLPYSDYDVNSEEEMIAVLKNQAEIIERKGLLLTQNASTWMQNDTVVAVNRIFQDRLTPYHDHDYYEINYVFKDTLVQFIEGKELVMHTGDLVILSPKVRHASFPVGENNFSINVLIKPQFLESVEKKLAVYNTSNYLNYLTGHSAYILFTKTAEHNIDTMLNECISNNDVKKNQYYELIRNNIMERILITLSECERYDWIFKDTYANHDIKERGERILQYMGEHYATITLEELAKKFGYSTQQIRRIIKKHSGYSFITALQHKRINHAMTLLQSTDLSIKEIAEMVGLESPEYFSRRFKYERGFTPTEFRKRHMKKNKDKSESSTEESLTYH